MSPSVTAGGLHVGPGGYPTAPLPAAVPPAPAGPRPAAPSGPAAAAASGMLTIPCASCRQNMLVPLGAPAARCPACSKITRISKCKKCSGGFIFPEVVVGYCYSVMRSFDIIFLVCCRAPCTCNAQAARQSMTHSLCSLRERCRNVMHGILTSILMELSGCFIGSSLPNYSRHRHPPNNNADVIHRQASRAGGSTPCACLAGLNDVSKMESSICSSSSARHFSAARKLHIDSVGAHSKFRHRGARGPWQINILDFNAFLIIYVLVFLWCCLFTAGSP